LPAFPSSEGNAASLSLPQAIADHDLSLANPQFPKPNPSPRSASR
jgi:hypothetical protein